MSGWLERIVESKRAELGALKSKAPWRTPLDASRLLRRAPGEPLRLLAEHKRKSPSAGELSTHLGPGERALVYARAGVTMVSVLCDTPFFGGGWHHVEEIRRAFDDAALPVPVLAKEFVLDPRQLDMALGAGADAVLLIVRILDDETLASLLAESRARGLTALVEVADEAEMTRALDAGASVVGVNARDLDSLRINPDRAKRLLESIGAQRVRLHLSGIRSAETLTPVTKADVDGALVGEALMRLDDPKPLLEELVAACQV